MNDIRVITVSGRIGAGSTTLAKALASHLGWRYIEGGEVFWEAVRKKLNLSPKDTDKRPDNEDEVFDAHLKELLRSEKDLVLETKLAGFMAQGIENVYKMLVVCEDRDGNDQAQVRIDRLVNRERIPVDAAKQEVVEREHNDLGKWRKLYAESDQNWTYFDRKYYNFVINTFMLSPEETLHAALTALEQK